MESMHLTTRLCCLPTLLALVTPVYWSQDLAVRTDHFADGPGHVLITLTNEGESKIQAVTYKLPCDPTNSVVLAFDYSLNPKQFPPLARGDHTGSTVHGGNARCAEDLQITILFADNTFSGNPDGLNIIGVHRLSFLSELQQTWPKIENDVIGVNGWQRALDDVERRLQRVESEEPKASQNEQTAAESKVARLQVLYQLQYALKECIEKQSGAPYDRLRAVFASSQAALQDWRKQPAPTARPGDISREGLSQM